MWGTKKYPLEKKQHTYTEDVYNVNPEIAQIFAKKGISSEQDIKAFNKVQVYGVEYKKDLFVAIDSEANNERNMPIFGRIDGIFVIAEEVYLYCKEYISEYVDESVNAYCIAEGSPFKLVNTEGLADCKPFSAWKDFTSNINYLCLRHMLV